MEALGTFWLLEKHFAIFWKKNDNIDLIGFYFKQWGGQRVGFTGFFAAMILTAPTSSDFENVLHEINFVC